MGSPRATYISGVPTVGGASTKPVYTIDVSQANDFTTPLILKNVGGIWSRALADQMGNADIWLCVEAASTSFKVANTYRIYQFPAHNLGATNAPLFLSATIAGALTTTPPTAGQARVTIGAIFDPNQILWAPSLLVETV
jgi:hypothetical protein